MLKEILVYIKTHTILIALNVMVVAFVSSLYVYDHFQVQDEIISVVDIVHQEMVDRKCAAAADRLLLKMNTLDKPNAMPNQEVLEEVLAAYQVALALAFKDNIECLILEHTGDSMLFAYKAGYKDGTKNNYVRGT